MDILSFILDIIYSSLDSDEPVEKTEAQIEAEVRTELDSELFANQEIAYPVKDEPVELEQNPAFEISFDFLKAGKAKFTVANPSGVHYTYQVSKIKEKDSFFVGLLTGPDNQSNYTYMGVLDENNQLRFTKKSGFSPDETPAKVFNWTLKVVNGRAKVPDGYSIQHSNACGRCGRELTHPESIRTGLGPECRKK